MTAATLTRRHLLPAIVLLAGSPALAEPAAPDSAPGTANKPVTRESVSRDDVTPILGQKVSDANGRPVGRIVDVLVDGAGTPRAAVVDAGGFMGIGQRRVAIAWHALRFEPGAKITLQLKADQVAAMPEYKPAGSGPVVVAAPQAAGPQQSVAPQQPVTPK